MKQSNEQEIKDHPRESDRTECILHATKHGSIKLSKEVAYLKNKLNFLWLLHMIIRAQEDELVKRHRIQLWEVQELKFKKGLLVFATSVTMSRTLIFSEIVYFEEFAPISLWLTDGFLHNTPENIPE